MNRFKISCLAILCFNFLTVQNVCVLAQDKNSESAAQENFDPQKVEFETYYFVFLKKGENRQEVDEKKVAEIQQAHLNHLKRLQDDGFSLAAGPFEVPPEADLRGIVIFRGDLEQEKVEALANADPAVQAGRLKVEVLKWWTPAGNILWPNQKK